MRSLFQQSDRSAPYRPEHDPEQRPNYRPEHRHAMPDRAAPVQITAMAERTSGLDENLGALLRDMRLALRMTPAELALRLSASIDIIATLEQGRLRALPHWEETQRVIGGLCALHRVDPRPILQRIVEQTSPTHVGAPPERGPGALHRAVERTHPPTATRRTGEPKQPPLSPQGAKSAKSPQAAPAPQMIKSAQKSPKAPRPSIRWPKPTIHWRKPKIGRDGGRVLMAVATPMVMIAAVVWAIQAQPKVLRDMIEVLPAKISNPVLSGLDSLAVRLAPRRDGLRWIEVADPSSRKADKLPVASR